MVQMSQNTSRLPDIQWKQNIHFHNSLTWFEHVRFISGSYHSVFVAGVLRQSGWGKSNSDVLSADWMEREGPSPESIHLSAAEISVTVDLFMP